MEELLLTQILLVLLLELLVVMVELVELVMVKMELLEYQQIKNSVVVLAVLTLVEAVVVLDVD